MSEEEREECRAWQAASIKTLVRSEEGNMSSFFHALRYLVIGAVATTSFEYFRKYNLLDFTRDYVVAIFRHRISDNLGLVATLALFGLVIFLLIRF